MQLSLENRVWKEAVSAFEPDFQVEFVQKKILQTELLKIEEVGVIVCVTDLDSAVDFCKAKILCVAGLFFCCCCFWEVMSILDLKISVFKGFMGVSLPTFDYFYVFILYLTK